jgi:hypothetical protein
MLPGRLGRAMIDDNLTNVQMLCDILFERPDYLRVIEEESANIRRRNVRPSTVKWDSMPPNECVLSA